MTFKRIILILMAIALAFASLPVFAETSVGATNVEIVDSITEGRDVDKGYSESFQYDDKGRIVETTITDFGANVKEEFSVSYNDDGSYILTKVSSEEYHDPNDDIKVFLNSYPLSFDTPPIITADRTLVPMRKIFEELGYTIDWNEARQRVTAVKGEHSIQLDIGDTLAILDNYESAVELDVPSQIVEGRTMVPLRFVANAADYDVLWDADNNAVHIKAKESNENARTNQSIAVNDNMIYNSGYKFAVDGSVFEESEAARSKSLQIYNDILYYLNADGFVCAENIATKDSSVIVSRPVKSPLIVDDKLYYIDFAVQTLYQAELDGSGEKAVLKELWDDYIVIKDKIYYRDLNNSNLMEYSLNSGETVTIYDGITTCFDVRYIPEKEPPYMLTEHGWYQIYYCDAVNGNGVMFYDKYDYQGVVAGLEGVHTDRLWLCGEDVIYRTNNTDGTSNLYRYGRFGVKSYNVEIVNNIISGALNVELHNGKLFYFDEGMTMTDKTPEWFMMNTDGGNSIPIMLFTFSSISYSHIEGNIPDTEHFDEYLKRDLTSYFSDKGTVYYILLRKSPSQVGVGFPHYYAWVTVSDENGNIVTEGAAQLNAMDKEVFAVTDFVTKDQILEEPSIVEKIFPFILHKRILELTGL